ncbi:MAG: MFS transporter [Chloroflexi bacterium]|nr:MFS transporter [Chloroflexota bacterium]
MTVLRAYRSLWVDRALMRLLAGEFISSIGDWLYLVALLVVVYERSADPVLLGIVGAARVLPYVVLSVPAGIAADRYDRRLVLLATDVARGAIMLALAALVALDGPLWAIVALAVLATCFSSFFGPTIGAFLPTLVGDESRLGPANSAWASLDKLAFVIGPAIGGLIIASSGLALAFLLNAVSFAVVAAVLWRLPRRSGADPVSAPAAPSASSAAGSGAAGSGAAGSPTGETAPRIGGAVALRPIVGLALLDVAGSFAFGGLSVLTVVLAGSAFGTSEAATGYLNAAIGVGGVIGALIAGSLVLRPRLAPLLVGGAVTLGAGLAALGATDALLPALIAMTIASAGSLLVEVVDATIFQRVVPDELRGRALGAVATVATLAYAGGSFAVPVLASAIGTAPVLASCGAAVVVASILAAVMVGSAGTRAASPGDILLRHVAGLPIFAGVAPATLEAILARCRRREIAAGTVVMRQGDPADRLAIVVSGSFEVTQRKADLTVARLRSMGPDEVFGEIGLLTGVPRTATVTATTPATMLELDGPDFLELVAAGPGLSSRFLDLHRGIRRPLAR